MSLYTIFIADVILMIFQGVEAKDVVCDDYLEIYFHFSYLPLCRRVHPFALFCECSIFHFCEVPSDFTSHILYFHILNRYLSSHKLSFEEIKVLNC